MKLLQVLRVLNTRERTQLKEFVNSPFHNKDKNVIKLLDHLLKYAPKFEHKALELNNIYKCLFKEKLPLKAQKAKITRIISQLFKLVEDFIIHYSIKKNMTHISYQMILLDFFDEQGIENLFHSQKKRLLKLHEGQSKFDATHYYDGFIIYNALFKYFSSRNDRKSIKQIKDILPIILYYISTCAKIVELQYKILHINFLKILKTPHNIPPPNPEGEKTIAIYKYAISIANKTASEEDFDIYKNSIQTHIVDIQPSIIHQLYAYAKNYCITKIKQGKFQYYRQLFELYEDQIKNKMLYFDEDKIQAADLRTIIFTAIVLKKVDWAINFLKTHKDRIIMDDNNSMYAYCKTLILFYQEKYSDSLNCLEKEVKFDNIINKLAFKRLEIKIYYKNNKEDDFDKRINAFAVFLFGAKGKLAPRVRDTNVEFVNRIKAIAKLAPFDKEGKKREIRKVKNAKLLAERLWLLQILGEEVEF